MRAAVLEAPGTVTVRSVADPGAPGGGEVRLRLEGAGVCASELPLWQGRAWFTYPQPPGEPGHEGWGVVEAIGGGVSGLRAGDRVAFIGSGAHAEALNVPASRCVPVPVGFPGEPLGCAANAWRRAGVRDGDRVAIVGAGFFGLLLVQLCRGVAAEVQVVSRRRSALELAERFGATRVWGSYDAAPREEAFDVVFEVTGHQQPLELAARLCRVRGRLVVVGYHQDGRRSVDMQLWNWRGLDVINAHERDPAVYVQGLREAVDAVAAGRLDPMPLVTHRYGLHALGEAYAISCARPEGFVKAVWQRD